MSDRAGLQAKVMALVIGVALPAAATAQSCPLAPVSGQGAGPLSDVRYLAADELEGRSVGSLGGRCAASYLENRFATLGLEPAGQRGDWRQPFRLRAGAVLAGHNGLFLEQRPLTLGNDWTPYGFAGTGSVVGPATYGGSGIARFGEAPITVSGRIVVLEAATPGAGSLYSDPHFKATIAVGRGARAVFILLEEGDSLPTLDAETRGFLDAPVVAITGPSVPRVRAAARAGRTFRLDVAVAPRLLEVANVAGILTGADPQLRDELVVVGAHFDHLGRGGEGSRAPGSTSIHNGADDNASGTAALLEVARLLRAGPRPARSILLIGFDGEERGMLGSRYYAENPLRPLASTVAMLNLDMVGRLDGSPLVVLGTATASEWSNLLATANATLPRPLQLDLVPEGRGASDHAAFSTRGIPALHFFTGTHADYHRPTDDWQLVDADGIARIAGLTARVALQLANGPGVTRRAQPAAGDPAASPR